MHSGSWNVFPWTSFDSPLTAKPGVEESARNGAMPEHLPAPAWGTQIVEEIVAPTFPMM